MSSIGLLATVNVYISLYLMLGMEFTLEFRETSDFYQGLRSNKIDSIFMLHFTFKPTHFEREMEPNFAGKFQTDF